MSEHFSADVLLRYLDRELDAHESARAQEHMAECADCRAQLDTLRSLSAAVDQHGAGLLEPAGPRRRELSAALEREDVRQEAMRPRKALAALAMAASVVLAVGLSLHHANPPAPPAAPPESAPDAFIALPNADEGFSNAGTVVMQIDLPRAAVALAGIPPGDGAPDGRVRAEVLVGADGVARAIR
ncbi:MAG TPA: zf-HC2 domain-containing protein, partial [Candidatus Solibacter sp.]|nr:zf-HC2 domain-containing protein [Candidatus Solibacter sp.]